jgi:hypothetical protein
MRTQLRAKRRKPLELLQQRSHRNKTMSNTDFRLNLFDKGFYKRWDKPIREVLDKGEVDRTVIGLVMRDDKFSLVKGTVECK